MREEALNQLKSAQVKYEVQQKYLVEDAEQLLEERKNLKQVIDNVWDFINSFRNKSTELNTELNRIQIETKKFSGLLESLEQEVRKANIASGGTAAAGIAAGAGIAAFAPSAAVAVAMTFGTASTGTAISALSGAAATNAALAWLGGGALAAGGGGTAAGSALLGLAGPVGWIIGGGALVTAGLMKSGKNKKIAEQAGSETVKVYKAITMMEGTRKEIKEIITLSIRTASDLNSMQTACQGYSNDYLLLSQDEKLRLGSLVNNIKSATELLNRTVGANA